VAAFKIKGGKMKGKLTSLAFHLRGRWALFFSPPTHHLNALKLKRSGQLSLVLGISSLFFLNPLLLKNIILSDFDLSTNTLYFENGDQPNVPP
jgi:hypothetical protein